MVNPSLITQDCSVVGHVPHHSIVHAGRYTADKEVRVPGTVVDTADVASMYVCVCVQYAPICFVTYITVWYMRGFVCVHTII